MDYGENGQSTLGDEKSRKMTTTSTQHGDAELAAVAAGRAGELLLQIRSESVDRGAPAAPSPGQSIGVADLRSDELLTTLLADARPRDAVLSEESASTGDRLGADRVWIIDPLDGTREYGEAGRADWAVHVALWERGALVQGAFSIPALGELWTTQGPPAPPACRPIRRIAVSRSRPPRWAQDVAGQLGAELIPMGSAGAKVAAVLRGDVDAYLHDGGQYEWDSAAPVVVARHFGYVAVRADGSELRYNQPDPYLPDLVVCPSDQADALLMRIGSHRGPTGRTSPTSTT